MAKGGLIPVLPRNIRRIVLHAVDQAKEPVVLLDKRPVTDLSERGPITKRGLRSCVNFEVRDGGRPILGFHDHPVHMFVSEEYADVAKFCEKQGWLKIEGEAS